MLDSLDKKIEYIFDYLKKNTYLKIYPEDPIRFREFYNKTHHRIKEKDILKILICLYLYFESNYRLISANIVNNIYRSMIEQDHKKAKIHYSISSKVSKYRKELRLKTNLPEDKLIEKYLENLKQNLENYFMSKGYKNESINEIIARTKERMKTINNNSIVFRLSVALFFVLRDMDIDVSKLDIVRITGTNLTTVNYVQKEIQKHKTHRDNVFEEIFNICKTTLPLFDHEKDEIKSKYYEELLKQYPRSFSRKSLVFAAIDCFLTDNKRVFNKSFLSNLIQKHCGRRIKLKNIEKKFHLNKEDLTPSEYIDAALLNIEYFLGHEIREKVERMVKESDYLNLFNDYRILAVVAAALISLKKEYKIINRDAIERITCLSSKTLRKIIKDKNISFSKKDILVKA